MLARLALAALLVAPTASAQLSVTLTTPLGGAQPVTEALFVEPHPGGGAVACFRTGASDADDADLVVVRVDRAGAELWRNSVPTSSRRGSVDSLTITPAGRIVLNTQDDNVVDGHIGELVCFEPHGTTAWTAWPAPVSGTPFRGRVAGLSPSGDVFLIGSNAGQGVVSALLYDSNTGAELWRTDLPGYSPGPNLSFLKARTNDGRMFAAFWIGV